jgi:hypothetical protein
MNNVVHLPVSTPASHAADENKYRPTDERRSIPKGLVEWITGTELLDRQQHGFAMTDIACVRAFWSCVDIGFSSAGFVVEIVRGQRFYLQCAIDDDNQPNMVAITTEELPAGQTMPEIVDNIESRSGWSDEVETFNIDLARMKAGNTA